jgi:hypothetical protein
MGWRGGHADYYRDVAANGPTIGPAARQRANAGVGFAIGYRCAPFERDEQDRCQAGQNAWLAAYRI